METEDDRALLAKVAVGEKAAMRVLYERHHDALFAFIRSRGCDGDAASDVLHDAMLEVWRTAEKYRGASTVRTWIFTIARNKFIDRVRRTSRLSFVEEVPELPDESPDAEAVVSASQDAARVRRCLGNLKDVQRSVIQLAFYEGLSYEEIAEIEDVPLGTIKSRIFHAKQAMMHCLSHGQSAATTSPIYLMP